MWRTDCNTPRKDAKPTYKMNSLRCKYSGLTPLSLLFVLVLIGLQYSSNVAKEPICHGQKLGYWVEQLGLPSYSSEWPPALDVGGLGDVSGAKRAIEKIGPKAIPFLLNWIRGEQSSASVYVPDGSLQAFRILGSRARPAIPQLAAVATNGLADSSDCSGSAARAVYALAGIGPAAVPVLSDFLTNRDAVGVKCVAIDAIKKMETDCSAAVPALLSCLRERDEKVAARAVDALGALGGHQRLGAYRAQVFLALTNNLQTRFPLRREILLALYAFGDQAAPALINAFHDKESGVRF